MSELDETKILTDLVEYGENVDPDCTKTYETKRTLKYKGNCSDYDTSQIVGIRGKYYRFVGASYDDETDCTTMELMPYHGSVFGSQGTVKKV